MSHSHGLSRFCRLTLCAVPLAILVGAQLAACNGSSGTGGVTGSGGSIGSGGAAASGGGTGSGGIAGTGGSMGSGGLAGTGGKAGSGGGVGAGGAAGATPSAGCGKTAGLASGRTSIDVGGKTREYIVALPSNYDQNHPYKLVFGWHPWGGSAQWVANGGYYGLQSPANNQAVFVAGEGLPYQGSDLGWGNTNGEDFAFLQAMLARFRSQLCIDEDRIFSVGFSFGAMFSFTIGCSATSMMRAIVPMAGNTYVSGGCEAGTRSVAVMAFVGTSDSLLSGHRQAVDTYATRDGCSTQTAPTVPSWCDGIAQTYLPCSCVSYQGCKAGYPVVACEYTAGHMVAPSSGTAIWSFLSQF